MLERVSRATSAVGKAASVMAGSTRDDQLAKPEVGSQRSATPKSRMSMMPSQKFGSDWPTTATIVPATS